MLNIHFHQNSAPITDDELRSVISGIRQALAAHEHPDKVFALLLSKMVMRINGLQNELAVHRAMCRKRLSIAQCQEGAE